MKKVAVLQLLFVCNTVFAQPEDQPLKHKQISLARSHIVVSPNPSKGAIIVNAPEGSKCIISSRAGTYFGTWIAGAEGFQLEGLPAGSFVVMIKRGKKMVTRKFVVI